MCIYVVQQVYYGFLVVGYVVDVEEVFVVIVDQVVVYVVGGYVDQFCFVCCIGGWCDVVGVVVIGDGQYVFVGQFFDGGNGFGWG